MLEFNLINLTLIKNSVHVVFGHVISGQEIVSEIENQVVNEGSKPLADVRIINCGELIPQIKPKGN